MVTSLKVFLALIANPKSASLKELLVMRMLEALISL